MPQLTPDSLLTLEAYSKARNDYRRRVIAHKKNRTVHLGQHLTLLFEDETTVRYQVQEMLRIERIFEEEGIEGELASYNPLIPDGTNFKATMLIEYENVVERARALARLKGIERSIFVEVEGQARVYAVADEDLERENEEKTAAVHFLRFEFAPSMIVALKGGAQLKLGCDHPEYLAQLGEIEPEVLASLVGDLA
jgi:hypothetical protein